MHALEQFLDDKTHIIWDWNGTLLNDIEMCVGIISKLLTQHGYEPVSLERYRQIFRFPVRDYYIDAGFDLDKISFEELTKQFMAAYADEIANCNLFHGVADTIKRLKSCGMTHSVLSAAHEGDLRKLLDEHELSEHFLHIYGLGDHYAASKIHRGKQLIDAIRTAPEKIIMIGDTDHDVEVAKAMGIDILLFGDGHQCPTRLSKIHSKVILRCDQGGPVRLYDGIPPIP